MNSFASKKTLIISGLGVPQYPLFSDITKREKGELLVISSTDGVISQPYGCLIRSIILTIYQENIDAIYIIVDVDSKTVNREELKLRIIEAGISENTISTLDYISVVKGDLMSWLSGPPDARTMVQKNIELIKAHPLIPKVPVIGCIVSEKSGEYETITG
jgi:carbonic anhydrase